MTEHAAVVFVFFFLAEYGSIVLMCILTSLLFLGGYLPIYSLFYLTAALLDFVHSELAFPGWHSSLVDIYGSVYIADKIAFFYISDKMRFFEYTIDFLINWSIYGKTITTGPAQFFVDSILTNPNLEGLLYGITIGLKSSIMIFVFI